MTSAHSINHQAVSQGLGLCIADNHAVTLWGPPGNGKSSVIRGISDDYKLNLEVMIASIHEPSDFSGIPAPVDNEYVRLLPLEWARDITRQSQENERQSIVFYDEINTAKPETQAALLQPILERKVGHLTLPSTTRSVAAANPASISAGGWDLSPPLANRFIHLDWILDVNTVTKAFFNGGNFEKITMPLFPKDPNRRVDMRKHALALVGMFLTHNPDLMNTLDDDFGSADPFKAETYAFASPRAWQTASEIYAAWSVARILVDGKPTPLDKAVLSVLIHGTIGQKAAIPFLTFVDNLDLQDPRKLLNGTLKFEMPRRPDQKYTILSSLDMTYPQMASPDTWMVYGDILCEVINNGDTDIAYRFVISWNQRRPKGVSISQKHYNTMSKILDALG